MTDEQKRVLEDDPDGLVTYEYIANNIENCFDELEWLIENMTRVDLVGQFLASAARYLNAIDPVKFAEPVRKLVAATIDRDREHRYLPDLLQGLYGTDYKEHATELCASDDNFRRIYKRLFPSSTI